MNHYIRLSSVLSMSLLIPFAIAIIAISIVLGDISNIISLDSLYKDLFILLGWSLSILVPNRLITISILFWSLLFSLL